MSTDNLTNIGTIVKTRGLKGELIIALPPHTALNNSKVKTLWLSANNTQPVPYAVTKLMVVGAKAYAYLSGINTLAETNTVIKQTVFVDSKLVKDESPLTQLQGLIGYVCVTEESDERIGEITDLQNFPSQILATIATDKGELLLPINDNFITNINHKKGIIKLSLPTGYMDIFLQ